MQNSFREHNVSMNSCTVVQFYVAADRLLANKRVMPAACSCTRESTFSSWVRTTLSLDRP
eukprot:3925116-Pleurochrysis_carterae.AAC.6